MSSLATSVEIGGAEVKTDLIAPVSIRYGRSRPNETVAPSTCSFEILSDNTIPEMVIGASMVVETTYSATTYRRFTGRIVGLRVGRYTTQIEASSDGLGRLARTTVPDYVNRYGSVPVGSTIASLLSVNGITSGANALSFVYDLGETTIVPNYVVPGGTALDVANQIAAYDVAGVLWERPNGEVVYSDGASRSYPTPSFGSLSLTTNASFGPPAILDDWIAEQNLSGLVNAVVVTWGSTGSVVTLRDETSIADWGEYAYYADLPIEAQSDAQLVASRLVANYAQPAIVVSPLSVELTIPNAPITNALSAVIGTIVDFLPGPPPIPLMPDACYLEGYTETIGQTFHRLDLDISDVQLTRAPQTWSAVTPTVTWANVGTSYPTLTWYQSIGVTI